MKIRTINGIKNNNGNDRVVLVKLDKANDGGWEKIDHDDFLRLIGILLKNEDVIYPRPKFKGAGMLMDEIIKIYAKHLMTENDSLARYIDDEKKEVITVKTPLIKYF